MVRRLEAVGFRAWPAATVVYDGSWQLRLTPGHPSRRLNCMVPLDPSDFKDLPTRIEKAEAVFARNGRPLVVRQSPLCPPQLLRFFETNGWSPAGETLVMAAELADIDFGEAMDHLPTHDIHRFTEACLKVDRDRQTTHETLSSILTAIKPPAGLFLIEDERTGPVAVTLCVQDNDMAGLSQVVVAQSQRRKGIGREIVASALRWAKVRGAKQAWLQVLADNTAAINLYLSMGFREAYRYRYWRKNS